MTDEQVNNNLIGALIAVVLVAVLVVFLFTLFSGWNQREETAESYYGSLQDVVKEAEESGRGEMSVFRGAHGVRIVFFGMEKRVYDDSDEENFVSFSYEQNAICVCFEEDEDSGQYNCDQCVGLDMPFELEYSGELKGRVLGSGGKFEIIKRSNDYLIKISAIAE